MKLSEQSQKGKFMKSMKKATSAEERHAIISATAEKFANALEKMKKQIDKSPVVLKLYGNYGSHSADASARILFLINELRGLSRDCQPSPLLPVKASEQ